ncbi:6332_t:CDS:2 [Ambispora gerdemannii]|uniref:6332_t:CDS:1 n=1 Tax=Ambispora gerdemannii TaxID=144530 RepID=A0A9N8UZU4_9GLOM|nr:6332_t:CDS:2 [Ambispora gerdemannii]
MNILPHKSYHVYNIKNREKVRKDEEKARQDSEAKAERALLAEREHRLNLLRQRAKQRNEGVITSETTITAIDNNNPLESSTEKLLVASSSAETSLSSIVKNAIQKQVEETAIVSKSNDNTEGHINFWAELEENSLKQKVLTNPEYEAEKKAKEDKWERTITMYLDDVSKDLKPWYNSLSLSDARKLEEEKEKLKKCKEDKFKLRNDPLTSINHLIDKKSQKKKTIEGLKKYCSIVKGIESSSESSNDPMKKIELLRAQRIQRERQERLKVRQLLNPNATSNNEETKSYNSQYNPEATDAAHHFSGGDRYSDYRDRDRHSEIRHTDFRHSDYRHSERRHSDRYSERRHSDRYSERRHYSRHKPYP